MKHAFRKRCLMITAAALMVFPGTTAFAKGRGAQRNDCPRQNVCTFVDADKNGICDHCNLEYCQEKICSFADTDKDGICDNCNLEDCRKQQTSQQDTSGQPGLEQASSESHPRPGCHRQGHGSGRGRGRG